MLTTKFKPLNGEFVTAPRWRGWPRSMTDVDDARSVLKQNLLKGLPDSTSRLRSTYAIVLGAGANGGEASCLLAQSGVGSVDVVDPDVYDAASFATQPSLYEHRGEAKALVQGERAQRTNPACNVRALVGQAQDLMLRDLRKANVLLVAGDNVSLLIWVGRMAVGLGIPLVQAAVHGETASAIVRGYDARDPENVCPMCTMSEQELNDRISRHGCEIGSRQTQGTVATRTMPAICHAAGALAANEAIKWLTNRDDLVLRGEEQVCSLFAYQSWRTTLPRNSGCDLPHRRWRLVDLESAARETTLDDLAHHAAMSAADGISQVRSEIPWVSFTFCGSCGRRVSIRRFARAGSALGQCECQATLTTVPQGMRSVIPRADLQSCRDQPVSLLGIESGEAIALLSGDQWVHFFTSENHQSQGRHKHDNTQ